MKIQNITAIAVAASLLVVSGGAVAYQAQVHEQKCQALETQFGQNFDGFTAVVEKNVQILKMIRVNPFKALELNAVETPSIDSQLDETMTKTDAAKAEFLKTCGEARVAMSSAMMQPKIEKVTKLNAEVEALNAN